MRFNYDFKVLGYLNKQFLSNCKLHQFFSHFACFHSLLVECEYLHYRGIDITPIIFTLSINLNWNSSQNKPQGVEKNAYSFTAAGDIIL